MSAAVSNVIAFEEVKRLENRIERAKALDARGRCADAAVHMRKAAEILEACIEAPPNVLRAITLLIDASDALTEGM